MSNKFVDLTGQRFGRLVAKQYIKDERRHGGVEGGWVVECDCGSIRKVRPSVLKNGQVSCGCLSAENTAARFRTHGRTNTFEFNVWTAMRKRCNYPKHPKYRLYGGRGITVCPQWGSFSQFLSDMGECPFDKGSIERLDNDKGYEPANCVWLLKTEQSKNRRNRRM